MNDPTFYFDTRRILFMGYIFIDHFLHKRISTISIEVTDNM